jgi:signal transduction histidine kinase
MSFYLVIHNIGAIVSAITAVGVAFFLFINGRNKIENITFAMVFLTTALFYVSHVIGVNIADPNLSRWVLMGNLVIFFIGAFNYHAVLAALKKDKEHTVLLACIYASAAIISIFFLIFPNLFLLPSVPKMYFLNYYEPGVLNWVRIVFLYCILIPASVHALYKEYKQTKDIAYQRQLKYFMLTMIVGYGVGLVPNFLVYNIPVDPIWGIFFVVVCTVPLVYGALKYELFSVQVIAKQAFLYSLAVGAVGSFITFLNYASVWIARINPNFPTWTIAFVSALLAVSLSVIVWRGFREGDFLKAEFITTVTHKFRTPLTYIKWATDNLDSGKLSEEDKKAQISYIRAANEKLVELTNILTTASDVESTQAYNYNLKSDDFSKTVEEVIGALGDQFEIKKITIVKNIEPNLIARFDSNRLKFILQVILENALHYSTTKGTVTVEARGTNHEVICSVKDSGVGMSEEQITHLFSKFYRSDEARKLDTEGMGMGLFISARIIEKLGGRIWAESEGKGKGSNFLIALPRVK